MRLIGTSLAALVSTLAGCSLLYNPNNLPDPKIDAAPPVDTVPPVDTPPPDMPTDVNLDGLVLDAAAPTQLFEGQGTGGSRSAILAITGGNIGPDAIVELIPVEAQTPALMIEVDNAHAVRSPSGSAIAVSVTLPIDPTRGKDAASDVLLTVQVTQMGATGLIHRPVPDTMIKLTVLPELTAATTNAATLATLYSHVDVAAGLTFAPGATRVAIRAVGSIVLGNVHADAAGQAAGPGGARGGNNGENGAGTSGGEHGGLVGLGLLIAGAGGGFGEAGHNGGGVGSTQGGKPSGDPFLLAFTNNASSGGGSGSLGAVGGGGGGAIEITAGGSLMVGQVTAVGAPGKDDAGGGSGGAIVLRSGGAATTGAISTAGGDTSNTSAGDGGGGRVRYDLAALAAAPTVTAGTKRQGAAFAVASAGTNPLITTVAKQPFQLVSDGSGTMFNVFVANAEGAVTESGTVSFGLATAVFTPTKPLSAGYNRICVTPQGGNLSLSESANCIDVAYVP